MKPILEIENLSKVFSIGHQRKPYNSLRDSFSGLFTKKETTEEFYALKDVSFQVEQGETVGIMGKNGAGKSTLLKILSKITPPSSGRIISRGRIASMLEVGTGFHSELSGRENIFFNGSILGMKRKEILLRFDEIVDFSGVERFLDTPLKHYSSGMQLRLAFSVAAFLEPEILVVDEVLAVGDAEFQKKCLNKMEDVSKSGRTILFVSHNMAAVKVLCPKSILLDSGSIRKEGPTHEIINDYLQSYLEGNGMRTWAGGKRPGNRSVKVESIALKDMNGLPVASTMISEQYRVEITFEVVEEGGHARFSFILSDAGGTSLFGSLSNQEPHFHGKALSKGYYKSTCFLSGNMLNDGRFYIGILGYGAHWVDNFEVRNALCFDAIDDGVLKADYMGSYGGFFRPALKWETEKL
jgi:lipopolysaccharide transport system ATP-binding protein